MATSKQETNPVSIRIILDNQDTYGGKLNQSLSLKNIKCCFKKRGEKGGGGVMSILQLLFIVYSSTFSNCCWSL